ncbi:MAG: MGH1-like glycoside hydrolase domain-containing protein [Muribaculaceae bacterium]
MTKHIIHITAIISLAAALAVGMPLRAQTLQSNNATLNEAFAMAVSTLDRNTTQQGLILAGADYGGEWTRDCAFNAINAASLIRTQAAEYSLWSVTNNRATVAHQYWDKIIWVIAAWNHYMVIHNDSYLRQVFDCATATMAELEAQCYNSQMQLFTGPAVFQDGIAGYDEPIYVPGNNSSYVLDHHADRIMCLSTNCIYYKAYLCLADMAWQLGREGKPYNDKAKKLKKAIRSNFYNKASSSLAYLIDQNGKTHQYTEALGVAFAVLYDVVSRSEAQKILRKVHITSYGVPCLYPCFKRFSEEKPGRHNVMIWPHVNMIFASACAHAGLTDMMYSEIDNLAKLATTSQGFYEIYDPANGKPSGGYQCGHLWDVKHHQTWCATGYLRQFINQVFGVIVTLRGLKFRPMGMSDGSKCTLSGIKYHGNVINITVSGRGDGSSPKACRINGQKASNFVGYNGEIYINARANHTSGTLNIEIDL